MVHGGQKSPAAAIMHVGLVVHHETDAEGIVTFVALHITPSDSAICRTGYTGVRCDMFNLPQTLDILKSFREDMVDIPSLHKRSADTLYGVVEATARYTVNAVIEEDLLSGWEDGIP